METEFPNRSGAVAAGAGILCRSRSTHTWALTGHAASANKIAADKIDGLVVTWEARTLFPLSGAVATGGEVFYNYAHCSVAIGDTRIKTPSSVSKLKT